MRKVTLTVIGIAGLSLLLCGSGEALAQTGDGGVGATAVTGAEQAAGGAGASPADLRQSVLQLQSEVAQLRQELAQVRSELANAAGNTGVGGSGQAGVAPPAAPPGAGATRGQGTPLRAGTAQETGQRGTQAPDTAGSGEAVVNAIYTGKVRSVSDRQLVLLDDAGQSFTVELGPRTRFISKGQRIPAQQLKKGSRVRATVDMLSGRNQATEVTTLP
jgi:hypothetical protein